MKASTPAILALMALLISACSQKEEIPDGPGGGHAYQTVFKWSEPVDIFGFQPENRYAYCPSAIETEDGSIHIFFCGNPQAGIMVDNVFHIEIKPDGTQTQARSVLQPTPGEWDSFHCCDPNVIEGQFLMNGTTYRYAMFYLGVDKGDCKGNEIGVAFSNDLGAASWTKYPGQFIAFSGNRDTSWGIGQVSAISMDKKGRVLLSYSRGEPSGTRVEFCEVEMSDLSNVTFGQTKAVSSLGLNLILHNCDFAVDEADNKVVGAFSGPTSSVYPTFVEVSVPVAYMDFTSFREGKGTWKKLADIDSSVSGYYRNHNACVLRNSFGYLKTYKTPTVFFTIATTSHPTEWSYRIFRTDGYYEKIEITE